ncbi:MAG: HlyD family efflux transporter periplasmic adaptor subunit [Armatimonadetes bacterium]|nr:HlyD family efflux transporter periplasmic adaptor subunit [Armatimonadota bacterium]NIM67535.1 HlyD family efflux transporter periplasmic adaptor subunit [Armatimonadota bacterium]NIN05721.1 HlyD family efflux transporter periplasmic adaptor subunit [Armatimonadota bacterium]NIT31092.1 HlyD family efflux transporter periplasmic adaptor subunit [Armatimonadota bacterium]
MDTTELERELRNQTLEYENRLADVDRAKAEIELLKEQNETDLAQQAAQLEFDENELKLAKEDLAKKERLLEERLVTGAQVDQAEGVVRSKELAVEKGKSQFELKKTEVESKEKQKQAEIRNIQFRADMAKSNLEETEDDLKGALLTAPAGGLVVMSRTWDGSSHRALKEGDNVHQRQTICALPDLTSMLVKVPVGESDAPKVRLGMSVLIRLEAIPEKTFHGSVKDISSLATEARIWEGGTPGKKNFEVTIDIKEVDPKTLKPGMTADVEFICDTVKDAVYVPIESVVERQGKTYVFVKDGERYTRADVKTGKYNDNFICVTHGLREGEVIALRDPTRELEQQEAGSAAPGAEKEERQSVPIPGGAED